MRTPFLLLRALCAVILLGAASTASSAIEFSVDTNPLQAKPGDAITVTFNVGNSGATTVEALSMQMRYPENLSFLRIRNIIKATELDEITCRGFSSTCRASDIMRFTLPDLSPGELISVNMVVTVDRRAPPGELIVFAPEIRIDGVRDTQDSSTVLVSTDPFFELSLRTSDNPAAAGDTVAYTLDYTNVSVSPSSSTVVGVRLPPGVSFVSASGNGVPSGDEVVWDIGDLGVLERGREQFSVRVNPGVVGDGALVNMEAYVQGDDSGFREQIARTSYTTQVSSTPGPLVSVELSPQTVASNKAISTLITVTNPTSRVMSDVRLIMRWPEHLQFTTGRNITTGSDSNQVLCDGVVNSTCRVGSIMEFKLSNIPSGGGMSVQFPAVVDSRVPAASIINFDVQARATGRHTRFGQGVAVAAAPPYLLTVDESMNPIPRTGDVEYSVNYANSAPSTSANTVLSLALPPGLRFKEGSNNVQHDSGVVRWNLGNVRSGHGGRRTVVATVTPGSVRHGEQLVAKATIRGIDSGAKRQSLELLSIARVGENPQLGVDLRLDPENFIVREPSMFYADYKNDTGSLLSNIRVLLRYPEGLSFTTASSVDTGADANTVNCNGSTTCRSLDVMDFDLLNLRRNDKLETSMPLSTFDDTVKLIPFQMEVRVNGVQVKNVSSTAFMVGGFSDAARPPVASKQITLRPGQRHDGVYGFGINTPDQVTRQLLIRFNGRREHLALSMRGYDIDRRAEVRVYLNNKLLGNLSTTPNNRYGLGDSFLIPRSDQLQNRINVIRVLHRYPADVWGIDQISMRRLSLGPKVRLRPTVVNRADRGWRFGRVRHKDGVELLFNRTARNLRFRVTGYDIDRKNEIFVFVNGKRYGNIRAGRSNRFGRPGTFTIRSADQVRGVNSIVLLQHNSGEKWGVTDLSIR